MKTERTESLDRLVAEKVMGWHLESAWKDHPRMPQDPVHWHRKGIFSGYTSVESCNHGSTWSGDLCPLWMPSVSLDQAQLMEETIAGRSLAIAYTQALRELCKASEPDEPMIFDLVHADPRRRCLAGLIAVGAYVGPYLKEMEITWLK